VLRIREDLFQPLRSSWWRALQCNGLDSEPAGRHTRRDSRSRRYRVTTGLEQSDDDGGVAPLENAAGAR
jgi:hypothetical protein